MVDNNYYATVKRLGIPDKFIEHGEQDELYTECGFSPEQIVKATKEILTETSKTKRKIV